MHLYYTSYVYVVSNTLKFLHSAHKGLLVYASRDMWPHSLYCWIDFCLIIIKHSWILISQAKGTWEISIIDDTLIKSTKTIMQCRLRLFPAKIRTRPFVVICDSAQSEPKWIPLAREHVRYGSAILSDAVLHGIKWESVSFSFCYNLLVDGSNLNKFYLTFLS